MLPDHALPQLILNRVSGALARLEASIWTHRCDLAVEASSPQRSQVGLAEAKGFELSPVEPNHFWGRLFEQRWCRVRFAQPTDGDSWMFWIDQGEATLYVDDTPYFGFNVAHRRCRLPAGVDSVWIQSSCIQSGIWHEAATPMWDGSRFEKAYLASRDDASWHAYHDLKCLFDLAMDQRQRENPQAPAGLKPAGLQPLVDRYTPAFRKLLRIMDKAIDALDTEGLEAFRTRLAEGYETLKVDKTFATCVLTGHAHVDLVWIWPERMGELKAVNVFATANHLLQHYPEFRFAYSQPASYEAVRRREPALYAAVREQIARGGWQATGAMQVESDTIFACGEALARSFLIGQEGFTEINGAPSRLTWLPDVFGYSACLPQIMRQTGVDFFFTTKMTWNAINRFPYSSFIWRGNDGSEVLAHVTQESGYVNPVEVDRIKTPMHANQQADIHDEYLLPVGYGDGGGGATDDMLERARRFSRLPGMPELHWDHPEAFFERLARVRDELPVYQGECYLEYHRGTYTTHANLKASFRALERALQVGEAVAAATGKRWEMQTAWKRAIFAQFHDYIPGSSVWDVYVEGLPELDAHASTQLQYAVEALGTQGPDCLFNPHALPVAGWHQTDSSEPAWIELRPLSGMPLDEAIQSDAPPAPTLTDRIVRNEQCAFAIDADGWIEWLEWEGTRIPQTGPLGQLILYPDRPAYYEAWDIDRQTLSLGEACSAKPGIESFADRHAAGFEVTRPIGERSTATVRFELRAGCPELRVCVALDWQEPEHLLKFYLPTGYTGVNMRCGIPFGSILRPQQPGKMETEAMWEIPFSRHLSVFDDGERAGMSLLTESKYGASVRDGAVGVSLVRSPRVTGFDQLMRKAWPAHLSEYGDQSPYSDLGNHGIELALAPYSLDLPRERQPAALAETLFTAPLAYRGEALPSPIESIEGGDSLIPCWVRPLDDGRWVLRLHEVAGQRGSVRIRLRDGTQLERTDLGGANGEPIEPGAAINFRPYQVLSLCLRPRH